MIRPFVKDMTRSELHAMLTGGFATIAGAEIYIYAQFGVTYVSYLFKKTAYSLGSVET